MDGVLESVFPGLQDTRYLPLWGQSHLPVRVSLVWGIFWHLAFISGIHFPKESRAWFLGDITSWTH